MRSYRLHRRWRPFGEAVGKTSKSISPIPTREGCGRTTRALEYLGSDHPTYIFTKPRVGYRVAKRETQEQEDDLSQGR